MSDVTAGRPRRDWVPVLLVAVLCNGLAAGIWKHAGVDVRTFCILFAVVEVIVSLWVWRAWGAPSFMDRASRPFVGCAILASVMSGLGWIAYFAAFEAGPLALVQCVTASYTAVAALLAVIFLREKLSLAQTVGVSMALAGGAVLAYADEARPTGPCGGGWLLAGFAAVALWGTAATLAKHAYNLPRADDARFFLVHALGLLVIVLPYGLSLAPAASRVAGGSAVALLVAILYVAGDLGVYAAIARGPSSLVNPLAGLYPIPSIAYGLLVLGETPGALGWLAIVMVLPGIVLAVPRSSPRSGVAVA